MTSSKQRRFKTMNKFEEIMLYLSDAKIELVAGQIDESVTTFDVNFKRCKNTKGKKLVRHIDKLISRCNDALLKYGLNRVHGAIYNVFQTQLENPFELEMNVGHEENDYCCYVELLIKEKHHGHYFMQLNEARERQEVCAIAFVNFKIKRSVDGSIKLYVQTDFATEGISSRQFMTKEQELVCEIDALIAVLYCVKLYAQGLDEQHSNDQFYINTVIQEVLEKKEEKPRNKRFSFELNCPRLSLGELYSSKSTHAPDEATLSRADIFPKGPTHREPSWLRRSNPNFQPGKPRISTFSLGKPRNFQSAVAGKPHRFCLVESRSLYIERAHAIITV